MELQKEDKEKLIHEAIKVAGEALATAFLACELTHKISGTIDVPGHEGNDIRFAISFERLTTQ